MMNSDVIEIYTDGACSGNPGPGGLGIVMKYKDQRKELAYGFKLTTNNRMELIAIIVALETLKKENSNVVVYSDSKYVVDSINLGWVYGWVKKGFKDKANPDLWKRFLEIQKKQSVNIDSINFKNYDLVISFEDALSEKLVKKVAKNK